MGKVMVADYEEVLATVAKYTEACKEGKSDIMRSNEKLTSSYSLKNRQRGDFDE